jgi:hypothetical protein
VVPLTCVSVTTKHTKLVSGVSAYCAEGKY